MANKFSKSITDRLEQESRQQNPTVMVEDFSPPAAEPSQWDSSELPAISGYLHTLPRRRAKGKTFYLDEDLLEAIDRYATSKGISESRLVNDILRSVLSV